MHLTILQQGLGYFAAALVFATFYMRTMVSLRLAAIASNIAFLGYGLGFELSGRSPSCTGFCCR